MKEVQIKCIHCYRSIRLLRKNKPLCSVNYLELFTTSCNLHSRKHHKGSPSTHQPHYSCTGHPEIYPSMEDLPHSLISFKRNILSSSTSMEPVCGQLFYLFSRATFFYQVLSYLIIKTVNLHILHSATFAHNTICTSGHKAYLY